MNKYIVNRYFVDTPGACETREFEKKYEAQKWIDSVCEHGNATFEVFYGRQLTLEPTEIVKALRIVD